MISEYDVNEEPSKNYYIERDAIVAALSDVVIVVECGVKSGTMYTIDVADYHKGPLAIDIVQFKNKEAPAYSRFVHEFIDELRNLPVIRNSCIVTVPSHESNKWSDSLLDLARIVSEKFNIINYSYLLSRHRYHEKLSCGGDRSIQSHLDSICINGDVEVDDKNSNVILVDDVTTSGNTLIACEKILKDFGFSSIYKFAIAKTTPGSEYI